MALSSPILTDEIGPFATVWWRGKQYHAVTPLPKGWDLVNLFNSDDVVFLSRQALGDGLHTGSIRVTKPEAARFMPPGSNFSVLSDLQEHEVEDILWRYFWAVETITALEEGRIASLGTRSLTAFMADTAPKVAEKLASLRDTPIAREKRSPRPRGPFTLSMRVPSPRSLRRYVNKFVDSGFDLFCFRWQQDRSCNGGRRLNLDVVTIIKSEMSYYASERRPTIRDLYDHVKNIIDDANHHRFTEAKLQYPSIRTIGNYIRRSPAGAILGGREGLGEVRKTFGPIGHGPEYSRVGERVELDGWSPHIYLRQHPEFLKGLDKVERENLLQIGERINVIIVIDAASAYVLACVAGKTEHTSVAESALRMAVSDKSEVARWAKCTAPWYHCGIENIAFDNGPAFSGSFRRKAITLTGNEVQPPAKRPWLRGHIESLFAQLAQRFVAFFTGRSFANVAERGDYDAVNRASLDTEEFMKSITKYIVDVHNCRQNRKDGLNPRRRFDMLANKCEPPPPPNKIKLRSVFGIERTLKLGPRGITHLGINYDSDWLVKHRMHHGLIEVRTKIDTKDLGEISVLIDGRTWMSVPSIRSHFKGLSVLQWQAVADDLTRKYGHAVRLDDDLHVRPAIRDLHRTALAAEAAAGLVDVSWNEEKLKQLDDQMPMQISYDSAASNFEEAPALSRGTLGTRFLKRKPPAQTAADASEPSPANASETRKPQVPRMKTRDQ